MKRLEGAHEYSQGVRSGNQAWLKSGYLDFHLDRITVLELATGTGKLSRIHSDVAIVSASTAMKMGELKFNKSQCYATKDRRGNNVQAMVRDIIHDIVVFANNNAQNVIIGAGTSYADNGAEQFVLEVHTNDNVPVGSKCSLRLVINDAHVVKAMVPCNGYVFNFKDLLRVSEY